MSLAEFSLMFIVGTGGITAGAGASFMAPTTVAKAHTARLLWAVTGLCFWSLGPIWACFATDHAMITRLMAAALCGGISAAGAVYFFSLVESPTAIAQEDRKEPPVVNQKNQNGPNFNVPGNNNNFYYNSPPQNNLEENNIVQGGVVVGLFLGLGALLKTQPHLSLLKYRDATL